MNKENFTQPYVSNPSCRTIILPRSASVTKSVFNDFASLLYNLLGMLRSKIMTIFLIEAVVSHE